MSDTPPPRNVHVVFVHGVGAHSRLSALLRPYQAMRANIRSAEAPIEREDPIPRWKLEEFNDGGDGGSPRLKLVTEDDPQRAVYFYEVNYAALASVVRGNQPLDLTELFVGLDLALNVARNALRAEPPQRPRRDGRFDVDDEALALLAQKLAGVLVAATVPILGLPSLVFRRFTQSSVAVFTRFFEDIATFALDMNGEALISAHLDRTLSGIVESPSFCRAEGAHGRDLLVIAAHSLGSLISSAYLVRHRACRDRLPDRLLTFGSPIGLVCWLWLLLDFKAMEPDQRRKDRPKYFTWRPVDAQEVMPGRPLWINVVNHLDPIATAFPIDYVALKPTPARLRDSLAGGQVHHRFIRTTTGTTAWPGAAHTAYFDDREGFIEILGRAAGLREGALEELLDASPPASKREASRHWQEAIDELTLLRRRYWFAGLAALLGYLGLLGWLLGSRVPLLFSLLYGWPMLTLGVLAFWQRLIRSRPTKRTSVADIERLPWCDVRSKPHRMRQHWRASMTDQQQEAFVLQRRSGWLKRWGLMLLSFVPTLLAMLAPPWAAVALAAQGDAPLTHLAERVNLYWGLLLLALFTIYFIAFAFSQFLAHWRDVIRVATRER